MKKLWILGLALCCSAWAGAQSREVLLNNPMTSWRLGEPGTGTHPPLKAVGSVETGQPAEGIGAVPGAKIARLKDAYFDAGLTQLQAQGNAITVYLRVRDPKGTWGTALFAKRGGHEMVQFNLFSVDLPGTPGQDIGFELHTETGFVMVSFPVSAIDPTAWHDLAGIYDGKRVRLLCDGKVMAQQAWRGGNITQNSEPVLIGGETEHGKPLRFFTGEMEEAAVWPSALSDAELALVMRKEAIVPGPEIVERYPSPIHYRPAAGRLADTIPFYWKGDYHIFYLRALDKVPWEHIVSKDLVHWQELPTALRSDGAKDGPDGLHMFTGSVSEHDGTFHIWYTGWNPENKEGRERISHATSPDLTTWTKHPEDGFFGDGVHYDNSDFRDPFVFWNEAEKKFWMVVCARDAKSKHPVQGVLKSDDDVHWTQSEPLKLDPPLGEGTPECPDVFKIGDTWHLIHSPSAGTTDMRYAAEVGGPYKVAETGSIDTPILYAAKRMFDGKRHVITGWIRDLGGEHDGGDMQWGGDQSAPREVYAGPNGMLHFKPVPEAVAVFDKTASALEKPVSLEGGKDPLRLDTPDNYMLDCNVKMDTEAELDLHLRQGDNKDSGYHLVLRPAKHEAEINGAKFKYPRPVTIDAAQPVKIQAFVQGSIIECFINDAYAFSCRAYDFRKGAVSMAVSGGNATVQQCSVRVPSKESGV